MRTNRSRASSLSICLAAVTALSAGVLVLQGCGKRSASAESPDDKPRVHVRPHRPAHSSPVSGPVDKPAWTDPEMHSPIDRRHDITVDRAGSSDASAPSSPPAPAVTRRVVAENNVVRRNDDGTISARLSEQELNWVFKRLEKASGRRITSIVSNSSTPVSINLASATLEDAIRAALSNYTGDYVVVWDSPNGTVSVTSSNADSTDMLEALAIHGRKNVGLPKQGVR